MMTDKQPEALRLADGLQKIYGLKTEAAELRRLHEVNAELVKALAPFAFTGNDYGLDEVVAARAVIRKATGEQQ
jgi:hypothetical protein